MPGPGVLQSPMDVRRADRSRAATVVTAESNIVTVTNISSAPVTFLGDNGLVHLQPGDKAYLIRTPQQLREMTDLTQLQAEGRTSLLLADMHPIQSFEFPNAAARLAATVAASDIGKVARQLDNNSFWALASVSPAVWKEAASLKAPGPGGWQPMQVVLDEAAIIPATPDAILIDREIDLKPLGLFASTARIGDFGFFIEKPDGAGGWVGTVTGAGEIPGTTNDAEGYPVGAVLIPVPRSRPHRSGGDLAPREPRYFTAGGSTGEDWVNGDGDVPAALGGDSGSPDEMHNVTRIRIIAKRDATVYSAGQQATIDALGYRVRVVLNVHWPVVWEREVPIPATDGAMVLEELVDLADFGMSSDSARFRFVAEFLRNGQPIRGWRPNEYMRGEPFDAPTYPLVIATLGLTPGQNWKSGTINGSYLLTDDVPVSVPEGYTGNATHAIWDDAAQRFKITFRGGCWYGDAVGYCPEATRRLVQFVAWRKGPLPTTFYDGTLGPIGGPVEGGFFGLALFHRLSGPLQAGELSPVVVLVADGAGNTTAEPLVVSLPAQPYRGVTVHFTPDVSTWQAVANAINALDPLLTDVTVTTVASPAPTDTLPVGAEITMPVTGLTARNDFMPGNTGGLLSVPTPPGAGDNCTLRVRLLVVPPHLLGSKGFMSGSAQESGPSQLLVRGSPGPTATARLKYRGIWTDGFDLFFGNRQVQFL